MKVEADFVCEHEMPQPWVTCHECMFLPFDQRPVPPKPEPEPPKPKPKRAKRTSPSTKSATKSAPGAKRSKRSARTSSSSTARPSRTLPKSVGDDSPPLVGDKDLAYEIPDTNLRYHVQGADKVWLPISTMPTELRSNGWVYLKSDDRVVARCRVKGVGYRDQRWSHESAETTSDVGPGPTLELSGDWEFMSVDIGPNGAVEIRGYSYLATGDDGVVRPTEAADPASRGVDV